METVSVDVLLFARAAEVVGAKSICLSLSRGSNIQQLRDTLIDQFPHLASLAQISRWALDSEFVSEDHEIRESVEIAMIPPVSGG